MTEVNKTTFEREVLQSSLPVLVDVDAAWCGPCQMMAPVIHQLAEEYEGKVKMVKVNVDQAQELAMSFGVSSIPTLAYFQGGQVKGSSVGFLPKESLEQKLAQWGRA